LKLASYNQHLKVVLLSSGLNIVAIVLPALTNDENITSFLSIT